MLPQHELPVELTGRIASIDAGDIRVREYILKPGYTLPDHAHSCPGVVLQVYGRFRMRVQDVWYELEPGRALVLPKGSLHQESVGAVGARCLLLEPREPHASSFSAELRRTTPCVVRDDALTTLAARVSRGVASRRVDPGHLGRWARRALGRVAGGPKPQRAIPGWIVSAWRSAQSEPSRWTVAGLARSVGVAPESLCRSFVTFFGVTPSECLRSNRLEEAAESLTHSSESISAMSHRLRFADQSHLTHAFKRRFGLTPARFRRQPPGTAQAHPW